MKYKTLKNETKLLGVNVVQVLDFESELLNEGFDSILQDLKPCYIFVELPSNHIKKIHLFESLGFQFSEFRIKATLRTEQFDINAASLFPFTIKEISEKTDLKLIECILKANPQEDRFSTDPLLNSNNISDKRNIHNIQKSFKAKDEFLLGVYNSYTNKLISFISGFYSCKNKALIFQKGILDKANLDNKEEMLSILSINYLKTRGIDYIDVVSTGFNIDEFNLLVNQHNFVIQSSTVILRFIA